jgi:hypothetical protein
MKKTAFALGVILLVFSTSCQARKSVCPPEKETRIYLSEAPALLATPTPKADTSPIPVQVGGKTLMVDQVVEGPLCNGEWSGTVYVACNVQVYAWADQPLFLKECNLAIKPGTVVYVADHNDSAYYNGCSCHTGEISQP